MTAATREPELTHGYFGNIVKYDKQPDGSLMVYGQCAGPELDGDLQIADPAWLQKAVPSWFEWGNVREQHKNIAAGVGVELTEDEAVAGRYFLRAHIVDPGTVRKVETKVLKGFSFSATNGRIQKDATARGGRIVDGDIVEMSLVDRPANQACKITFTKSYDGILGPVDAPEVGDVDSDGSVTVAVVDVPDSIMDAVEEGEEIIAAAALGPLEPVEKSVSWYRDAQRIVEDALAGLFSSTVPFITKSAAPSSEDERADVQRAQDAMDQVLDLIALEAQQAKGGRIKELRDVEVLLSACRSLCCFIEQESGEDDLDSEADEMAYAASGHSMYKAWDAAAVEVVEGTDTLVPMITKTAVPRQRRAPAPHPTESTVVDSDGDAATIEASTDVINKAVASALAESQQAHEAELATLRAQLEKAQSAAQSGSGPVAFRHVLTKSSTTPERSPEAITKAAKAAEYRTLADKPGLDKALAAGYRALADQLESGASA